MFLCEENKIGDKHMGADFSGLSAAGGRSTVEAQIKSMTRELDGEKAKGDASSSKSVSGANGESTDVKSGGGKDESKISDLQSRLQSLMNQRESMVAKENKDAKSGNEKDKDKVVGNAQQQQQPKAEVSSSTNNGTSGQQSEQPKKVESGSASS